MHHGKMRSVDSVIRTGSAKLKLFRAWPRPPEMSPSRYAKYRLGLAVGIVVWIVGFGVFAFWWSALPLWLKVAMVIVLFFVAPDIDAVEQVFTPYGKYRQGRGSQSS